MTNATTTKAIESAVTQFGFATPIDIMRVTGLDYAVFCDTIESCSVRGVLRGNAWGYVSA